MSCSCLLLVFIFLSKGMNVYYLYMCNMYRRHLALCLLGYFSWFLSSADFFFKIKFIEKFFQEYQLGVKLLGSRSSLTKCRAWSGSKLFAKVISRWQNSPLAGKELDLDCGRDRGGACQITVFQRYVFYGYSGFPWCTKRRNFITMTPYFLFCASMWMQFHKKCFNWWNNAVYL